MKDRIHFFHDIVMRVAQQSRCRSRQVGAIIVFEDRIIAEGWNSPPRGVTVELCSRCDGQQKSGANLEYAVCTHAEVNAISSAAYLGFSTRGCEIVCSVKPCSECAKLISTVGIRKVICFGDYDSPYTDAIFQAAGIPCEVIESPGPG